MRLPKFSSNLLVPGIVLVLYLVLRLVRLTDFPMLNDESIYLNWAQQIVKDRSNLVLPVVEGRQPLFIWLVSLSMLFFSDPLLSARIISVIAGLVTLLGIISLTKQIFKKNIYIYLASFLYIFSPFALVYDRLALLDSLVASFTIWSIYFTLLLARNFCLDIAYTLGFIIGGGLITKSNGVFNLYLLPISLILFNLKDRYIKPKFIKWALLMLVVFGVSQLINSIMTIIPNYSRILDVNQIFIIPKKEFIKLPLSFIIPNFLSNLKILLIYFIEYMTIPYVLILFASFLTKEYRREKLFLLLYFLLPLLVFSLFARQLLPRYIYFMTISLFPLCSYGAVVLYEKLLGYKSSKLTLTISNPSWVTYLIGLFAIPCIICTMIVVDLRNAQIPKPEKINYAVKEAPFVKDSLKILNSESKDKKIHLVIEGYIGWAPDMYKIYLNKNSNVTISTFTLISVPLAKEVLLTAEKMPTYVIIPRFEKDLLKKNPKLIKVLERRVLLGGTSSTSQPFNMIMYKVNTQ